MKRKSLIKITLISSLIATAGCSTAPDAPLLGIQLINWEELPGIYRIEVQQGNLITQQMVNELKLGMTGQQVRYILGTPSIQDIFHDDRWDYLYMFKPASRTGDTEVQQQLLVLHFKDSLLFGIEGDLLPQDQEAAEITRKENRERTIIIPADAPRELDDSGFLDDLLTREPKKRNAPLITRQDGEESTIEKNGQEPIANRDEQDSTENQQ